MNSFDQFAKSMVNVLAPILFWEPIPGFLPLILLVMIFGGIFCTFRFRFVHLKLFGHSLKVIAGKYDDPNDKGQISHFQALTSALSGTVGLGNIAGVAIAIGIGGPGALFWMWVTAFFGMSMKFCSSTLGQVYRRVNENGEVLGGPMVYLEEGFREHYPRLAWLGKGLGILFALLLGVGAVGAVSLFQANQTYELLVGQFSILGNYPIQFGILLSVLTGIVILGGIKRIGDATSKMVPLMCLFYFASCLFIIFSRLDLLGAVFSDVFTQAFIPEAAFGGFIPVLINGVKRASFSNEAGLGSASIAHATAKTSEPVREGLVAMIGPFIDTHIVCTMTALTILITGVHLNPDLAGKGALMTAAAFATLHPVMPLLLTFIAVIFAYSTIITWGYYGQKAAEYLGGRRAVLPYRIFYVSLIVIAPAVQLMSIINLADMLLLSMALPNILGMVLLSKKISRLTKDYLRRLKVGEMQEFTYAFAWITRRNKKR